MATFPCHINKKLRKISPNLDSLPAKDNVPGYIVNICTLVNIVTPINTINLSFKISQKTLLFLGWKSWPNCLFRVTDNTFLKELKLPRSTNKCVGFSWEPSTLLV